MSGNWSLKAEYLRIDFSGSETYTSPLVAPAGVAPGYSWGTREHDDIEHVVRAGINYRFR